MIVVDSCAVVDLLIDTGRRGQSAARLLAGEAVLAAPHLIDAEISSVLLRMERRTADPLPATTVTQAIADYRSLPIRLYEHRPLLDRVRQLAGVGTYDAFYIALAEGLDVPLLTSDSKLAKAPGPRCPVINLRDV